MKNTQLIETAKTFNLYTRDNIPAAYTQPQILNGTTFDYSDRLNHELRLPDPILSTFPHGLFFEAKEHLKNDGTGVELYYIDHVYTLFLTPGGNLAMLRSNKNKWHFSPYYAYFREFNSLSASVKSSIYNMPEPNLIGKFTAKKVSDWLNHVDAKIDAINKAVSEAGDKNADIEAEIQTFVKKSNGKVYRWQNKTEVTLPNFTVLFTHHKESQYLETKINYNGNTNDLLTLLG